MQKHEKCDFLSTWKIVYKLNTLFFSQKHNLIMNSGRSYYFIFILNVHIHKCNWMHCFWMIQIWPYYWFYLWSNRLCVPPLQQFWRRAWYYVHWIGFLNDDLPLFTWYICYCYIHLSILTIIHGTILLSFKSYLK